MSYSVPTGSAVDFAFTWSSYTAPSGSAVAFDFTVSATLDVAGAISVEGHADVLHSVGLFVAGAVAVGGTCVLGGNPLWIVARGNVSVNGIVDVIVVPSLFADGGLSIVGAAEVRAGNALSASGRLAPKGRCSIASGRSFRASGKVSGCRGNAQIQSGSTFWAGESLSITGRAELSTFAPRELVGAGSVVLRGCVGMTHPRESNGADLIYVRRPTNRIEVRT